MEEKNNEIKECLSQARTLSCDTNLLADLYIDFFFYTHRQTPSFAFSLPKCKRIKHSAMLLEYLMAKILFLLGLTKDKLVLYCKVEYYLLIEQKVRRHTL